MQLLCLTDAEPATALPGLEILAHEVSHSPLSVKTPSGAARQVDLIIVDGTRDTRRARTTCLELKRDDAAPRLLVSSAAALPAVTAEWGVSDVILPGATPAEIDLRLRLAVSNTADRAGGRARASTPDRAGTITAGGVLIDEHSYSARVFDRTLDLTYKEFELLHFLTAQAGRVFTREQLLSEVWGTDYFGGTRTVDVHIRRLRAKLGDHDSLISTVRGVGYGFARQQADETGTMDAAAGGTAADDSGPAESGQKEPGA